MTLAEKIVELGDKGLRIIFTPMNIHKKGKGIYMIMITLEDQHYPQSGENGVVSDQYYPITDEVIIKCLENLVEIYPCRKANLPFRDCQ